MINADDIPGAFFELPLGTQIVQRIQKVPISRSLLVEIFADPESVNSMVVSVICCSNHDAAALVRIRLLSVSINLA